ncbi:hypothetical protein HYT33_04505 [Candidatus Roizmanbacteria bacterium]|nr:hypothetical protein [Candidatus Roizmanbacteria bacterium]
MVDVITETKGIPAGYEKVRRGRKLKITKDELPWLPEKEEAIKLFLVEIRGGGSFFLGSAVRGKRLLEAANQLDERRNRVVDNMLHTVLPGFIRDKHHPAVRPIEYARTSRPIQVTGNESGQRAYFMRFPDIGGKPVIIRLAVCDKARQEHVLAELSTESITQIIKKRGGGT